MDKITNYQNIVSDILKILATRIPVNKPNQKKHLVINEDRSEYILVSLGHTDHQYDYNVVAHLELKDGKILIHEESIDPSIFERLMDKGVPETDILPVYLPDYVMN
jgi:metal-dependent hydrolase (beta-lactamase superfamily II)